MLARQSTSSPAVSTPENPPPITTKCPSRARTAGSCSSSMRAILRSTMLRTCIASPTVLSARPCSASPGSRSRRARLPNASSRCSYGWSTAPASVSTRSVRRLVSIGGHPPHDEARRPDHLPDRRDHLLREHRRAERLGQHGVERGVALVADQQKLVTGGKPPIERPQQRGAGEPAADDRDRLHVVPPAGRVGRTSCGDPGPGALFATWSAGARIAYIRGRTRDRP